MGTWRSHDGIATKDKDGVMYKKYTLGPHGPLSNPSLEDKENLLSKNFLIFPKNVFPEVWEMELYELGNWTKIYLEKGTYVLSKNVFLIFWEIELSSSRFKKFQEKTFRAEKNITLWKNFLYFGKWNFLARSLKSSYIFSKRFKIMQNNKLTINFFLLHC